MHLPIIISRFSNLLFFAQKTGWHHNENFNPSFYGKSENKIWKQIEKSIGKQNTKQIKKTIAPARPNFVSHWYKVSKHLFLWKQYFQNNGLLFQQIIFDAKKLSGIKNFAISKVPIYLISNPSDKDREINAWFSWMPKETFIVVEIPLGFRVPNNFFPLGVLVHEFFHLMLRENKNLFSKISKIAKENEKIFTKLSEGMPNRIFLEELLISSFIPEGYLSEKYFNTKVVTYNLKPQDLLGWRKLVASKLHGTAREYLNNAQRIDKNYLVCITSFIKQNVK